MALGLISAFGAFQEVIAGGGSSGATVPPQLSLRFAFFSTVGERPRMVRKPLLRA